MRRTSPSGGRRGDFVIVATGLSAGQLVVTDGQLRLVAGARVELKGTPAADTGAAADPDIAP